MEEEYQEIIDMLEKDLHKSVRLLQRAVLEKEDVSKNSKWDAEARALLKAFPFPYKQPEGD